MRIVIIGGVAGGASAAARARRLSEDAEIVVIERGEDPSFANCGMPYFIGGEIESRDQLLVAPAERLRTRYHLDVRTRTEATEIDRSAKTVTIRDLRDDNTETLAYDKLIISTGASPIKPPLPGIDDDRVFTLRSLSDADCIADSVRAAKRAIIVGGGFIGVELAENFVRRGLHVTVVEFSDQILGPWDPEMVRPMEDRLRSKGVDLLLGTSAKAFRRSNSDALAVELSSGDVLETDFAVISIGVRPENQLAKSAGLDTAERGGIVTNPHMQTNDPDIYAVGDVAQVTDAVSGEPVQIPLAGPANRQGRIAADHIFGRDSRYRGTQGTSIVGAFGIAVGLTGLSEKSLQRIGRDYQKIFIHPTDHASYYPGAHRFTLKLLFSPKDGKILGAQAVGEGGVDKRIDVLAMAIQAGMTVFDLEEAELCYAPQFGSAKDPVNMAGFVAAGVLRGDHPVTHWSSITRKNEPLLIDVRTASEFAAGHVPEAVNIPLDELRERLHEIPRERSVQAYCQVGQRGYYATRILQLAGFDVANVSGGYRSWLASERNST